MQNPWRGRALALAAGLLYPLAFAPWGVWPLLFVSIAAGWLCLTPTRARESLLRGWLFGLGLFGFGVSWLHVSMHVYGYTPLWLAIPLTGLFAAVLALFPALGFWLTARLGGHALVFAGLWILSDWLRGWLFTGFPWLYPGYALIDTPLAGLAPVGGIWLVSLVAVLSALAVAQLFRNRRELWFVAPPALLAWLLAPLLTATDWVENDGEPVPVALVQGDIPQDIKWQLTQRDATRQVYEDLTAAVPDGHLVIWPESAITEFYQDARGFLEQQGERLAQRDGALITGIPWRSVDAGGRRYFNSVAVIDGSGRRYDKQKLVPFGEYVPFQALLRGLIPFFDLPMSSFTAGRPGQPNLQAMGLTIAPFICYEVLYPALVARRSHDSDVLLTISNDAWFGTSAGPHQHFQMARMRALETGRWLLRGTNNGITAIVDPRGQVQAQAQQFTRSVLAGSFRPVSGQTPFMRLGGWPWLTLALALAALGCWRRLRRIH